MDSFVLVAVRPVRGRLTVELGRGLFQALSGDLLAPLLE